MGVKKDTFKLMLSKLKEEHKKKRQTGFNLCKLTIPEKLMITLNYLRENRTMEHIGVDYGVAKSTVCKTIYWVENILSKCDEFKLPSKRELKKSDMEYEVFVVDATETPIERPTTKNKRQTKRLKKKEK
jgi:hypothetical protein